MRISNANTFKVVKILPYIKTKYLLVVLHTSQILYKSCKKD